MESSHRTQAPAPDATLRDAGPAELLKDVLRMGPAPNPSREAFVTAVNFALVVAVVLLFQPEPVVTAGLVALIAVFTAIRWVVGTARWRKR